MKLDPKSKYDDGLADLFRAAEMAGSGKVEMAKYFVESCQKKIGVKLEVDWGRPLLAAERLMDNFFKLYWGGKAGFENELAGYQIKLDQLIKDWAATRGGSRYGDEYLETQIKVYTEMIRQVKEEMAEKKRKAG